MPFSFHNSGVGEILIIEPRLFPDDRGFFFEAYKYSDFSAQGIPAFVQDNQSHSRKGILRGLHFQAPPFSQGKLVRVVAGEVIDVGVDLRQSSATYGKSVAVRLSAENKRMLYLPPWCAHGFEVLSDEAEVIYKVTTEYNKDAERGLLWSDSALGIDWPDTQPLLTQRDANLPCLAGLPEFFK